MRLFELFAKPYTWVQLDDETYGFETNTGLKYKVLIIQDSLEIEGQYERGYWVEFGLVRASGAYKYNIERTGDAFNVFATVAAIIKQRLSTAEPVDYVFFTASESSRVKLYDAFMKLIPRFLPGWEFYKTEDDYGDRKYIIKSTSAEGA